MEEKQLKSQRHRLAASLVALGFAFAATGAQAIDVPVLNPSFENPVTDFAQPGADNWDVEGTLILPPPQPPINASAIIFLNTAVGQPDHINNATGLQLASIAANTGSAFKQTLATPFTANTAYELKVDLGVSQTFPPLLFTAAGDVDQTAVMKIRIALFFDDAGTRHFVGTPNDVSVGDLFAALAPDSKEPSTTLVEELAAASAADVNAAGAVGKNIGVVFSSLGDGVAGNEALEGGFWNLDNVRLTSTTVTPEPASLATLLVGTLALVRRRRR